MNLTQELGVPLAEDEREGLVQKLSSLGIELDTVTLTSRLPKLKVVELKDKLSDLCNKFKSSV